MLGAGGDGAFINVSAVTPPAGGYNGGGRGGGYVLNNSSHDAFEGGGGGGGFGGGGGGGGVMFGSGVDFIPFAKGGGGGGGGSNLVPAGASASLDTTGNPSITLSFPDTTPPVVSLDAPPARTNTDGVRVLTGAKGTVLGDGAVTVDVYSGAAATGSPVATLAAFIDVPGWFALWPTLVGQSSLPDGQYTVQATQVDGAGNVGVSAPSTLVLDNIAPVVTLTSPTGGSVTNQATPRFAGVAGTTAGDGASVTVSIFDSSSKLAQTASGQRDAVTGAYSFRASSALSDGSYTAVASQTDDAGNTGQTATVTFRVDTQPPVLTLTAPAAGRSADTTPSFAGAGGTSAGDNPSVTVRVYRGTLPSGPAIATLTAAISSGAYHSATARLADGTYTTQASQSDTAGNVGTSAPVTFTVDTTAPAITLTNPASGAVEPAIPTFSGVAGTATGDGAQVTIRVYAGGAVSGTLVRRSPQRATPRPGATAPWRRSRSPTRRTPRRRRRPTTSATWARAWRGRSPSAARAGQSAARPTAPRCSPTRCCA